MKLHKKTVRSNIRTLIAEFASDLIAREKIIKAQQKEIDHLKRELRKAKPCE